MSEATTYLELRDLRVSYGKVEALHGISVHVEQGEIVTILGANGAGKTTTLTTISGLFLPLAGGIWTLGGYGFVRFPPIGGGICPLRS